MDTFHPFPRLPFELRDRILYLALASSFEEPRIIHYKVSNTDSAWEWVNRDEIVNPDQRLWYTAGKLRRVSREWARGVSFHRERRLPKDERSSTVPEYFPAGDMDLHELYGNVDFDIDIFYLDGHGPGYCYEPSLGTARRYPYFLPYIRHVAFSFHGANKFLAGYQMRSYNGVGEWQYRKSQKDVFFVRLNASGYPSLLTARLVLSRNDQMSAKYGPLVSLDYDEFLRRYPSHRAKQTLVIGARAKSIVTELELAYMEGSCPALAGRYHPGLSLWFAQEHLIGDNVETLWGSREEDTALDALSAEQVRRVWATRKPTEGPVQPSELAHISLRTIAP